MNANPVVFYDGTCGMCTAWAKRLAPVLARREIEVKPFVNGAAEPEMIYRKDGIAHGGADAVIALLKAFPITYLLGFLLGLPVVNRIADFGYRYIAQNRHCNQCTLDSPKPKAKKGWFLLITLLGFAYLVGALLKLEGWIWMWLLAAANWFGFKWMCFNKAGGWSKVELIYFLWPGMDTEGFRYSNRPATKLINIKVAIGFIATGLLIAALLPMVEVDYARGWLTFVAMLCLLHFGSFAILAALLNRIGFAADPIMREPWLANGLGDFWSNRWNRAFSDWARGFLYYPLTRKLGVRYGTLAGFFASGIAHEIAISVPARAGYGLPTVYFMIQGAGLLIAKHFNFRLKGLDRFWMWTLILIPAPLLFHPPFFENVFNPMTEFVTQLINL